MRLLLDTHFALWWQTGDPRVTEQVRQLVDAADEVRVSRVSLWELAIKAGLGRLRIDLPVFAMQVKAMRFAWLPISAHRKKPRVVRGFGQAVTWLSKLAGMSLAKRGLCHLPGQPARS